MEEIPIRRPERRPRLAKLEDLDDEPLPITAASNSGKIVNLTALPDEEIQEEEVSLAVFSCHITI